MDMLGVSKCPARICPLTVITSSAASNKLFLSLNFLIISLGKALCDCVSHKIGIFKKIHWSANASKLAELKTY